MDFILGVYIEQISLKNEINNPIYKIIIGHVRGVLGFNVLDLRNSVLMGCCIQHFKKHKIQSY